MRLRLPLLAAVLVLAAMPAVAEDIAAKCSAKPGCEVVGRTDAGVDALGRPVALVELRFLNLPGWMGSCIDGYREFWAESLGSASFIVDICNFPPSHIEESEAWVEVGVNRLAYVEQGLNRVAYRSQSHENWMRRTTYQLSPPMILSIDDNEFDLSGGYSRSHWETTKFSSGMSELWEPLCDAQGEIPDPDTVLPTEVTRYLLIPEYNMYDTPDNIAEAELGTCSLELAFWPQSGFLTDGDPRVARSPGPSLRVLALDRNRLMFTAESPRGWEGEVSLEIWQREIVLPPNLIKSGCRMPETPMRQWIVSLQDGTVTAGEGTSPAAGAPVLLAHRVATDAEGNTRTTLVLEVHYVDDDVTIALASSGGDGDNGAWRLASSTLVPDDPRSLGRMEYIDFAACGLRSGRYDLVHLGKPIKQQPQGSRW